MFTKNLFDSPQVRRLFSIILWVNAGIMLCIMLAAIFVVSQETTDFCQDYTAARRLIEHSRIYAPLHCVDHAGLVNLNYNAHPPFSVLFYVPLVWLPQHIAAFLWALSSLGLYLASWWILFGMIGVSRKSGVLWVVILSLLWRPFETALIYQNIIQVIMFCIVLSWYFMQRQKSAWSGILLGIATLLRIWPGALIVGYWLSNRRKEAVWAMGTVAVGGVVSYLLLGQQALLDYLGPVQQHEFTWVTHVDNLSFVRYGTLVATFWGLPLPQAVRTAEVLSLIAFGGITWYLWRISHKSASVEAVLLLQSIFVTLTLVLFPLIWNWGLLIVLLPIVIVYRQKAAWWPKRTWRMWFFVGLLLLINPLSQPLLVVFPHTWWVYIVSNWLYIGGLVLLLSLQLVLYKSTR